MTTTVADTYRGMKAEAERDLETLVQEFLARCGELVRQDQTVQDLHESIRSTMRKRLLGGQYRSRRERDLIVRILGELKKILES